MAQLENFRLKVFRAVAERLSFHKAAEDLFLTQPAVTLQIKALENDLGVRLFDRAGGKISLTRQGSVLLSYANKIATFVAETEREMGSSEGQVERDRARVTTRDNPSFGHASSLVFYRLHEDLSGLQTQCWCCNAGI